MKKNNNRRRFLQLGLGATAGIITTGLGCGQKENGTRVKETTESANCIVTTEQTIGPFYPHVKNGDGDMDLTTIQGKEGQAEGQIILVRGRIMDEDCKPIENTRVEIWQANHLGRYSHEGDSRNPIPLDPYFEGWGEMATDASGNYGFKTIKPAAYSFDDPENPENWRTPHIHFKVSRRGYHEVITQMYFEGEELNKSDLILNDLPEEEQGKFILSPKQSEKGIPLFNFDLTLKKVASSKGRLAALDACTGKYDMNLPFGTPNAEVIIHRDNNKLLLDIKGYTSVELKPAGRGEFTAPAISRRFVFNRNGDKTVNSVTVHSISTFDKVKPFVAQKI